ncbi:MAG: hypothetical protein AAGB93_18420 [Planctomycetota bacterium]
MRSIRPTTTGARALLGVAALAACGAAAAGAAGLLTAAEPEEAWRRTSAVAFPEAAAEALGGRLDGEAVQRLAADLDGESHEIAARAAVLLGAALADPAVDAAVREEAALVLRVRLESRQSGGARHEIAADVVAARALDARAIESAPLAASLASLASGESPHPDLAVRVECASVALAAGRRDVVPFLLAILRAETPDQAKSPRTWERITTLAWVKTRAADALSRAAGLEMRFRPDGSWAHQTEEADRLEAALQPR